MTYPLLFVGVTTWTTQAVIEATSKWAQMGFEIEEASKLAEASAIFSNISENMDINAATDTMISSIKAFGFEADDAITQVVDKVNQLGNSFAITNSDLANILTRSASAMEVANNSIDQILSLGTAANEIVQDSEKVGTAMKTISLRLMQVDEETGTTTEELEKLGDTLKGLTGVSIFESDGETMRSTYEILKSISEIFDDLSDSAQADVLQLIGGTRQANIVSAILTNFSVAEKALSESIGSANSSLTEQATYMDSISARVNEFKESITGLWQNTISTDSIKNAVTVGTTLIGILDKLVNSVGNLGLKLLATASAYTVYLALKKSHLGLSIASTVANIKEAASIVSIGVADAATALATKGFSAALKELGATMSLVASASPLAVFMAITTAITLLSLGIDAATTSLEEQKQELEDVRQEYNSLKSDIENLNTELETTQDRIDELNGKDHLTIIEQSELVKLKETNIELQRQIDLLNAKEKKTAETLADTTETTFNKQNETGGFAGWEDVWDGTDIVGQVWVTETERFQEYLQTLESIERQKKALIDAGKDKNPDGTDSQAWIDLQNQAKEYDGYLTELSNSYQQYLNDYEEAILGGASLDEDQEAQYNSLKQLISAYSNIVDPIGAATAAQEKFNLLLDSDPSSKFNKALERLSKQGNITSTDILYLASVFPELRQYLIESGISTDDLAEYLNTLSISSDKTASSIKSLSDIYAEIKDNSELVSKAYEEMSDSGTVSVDTMMELIDAGLATESAFTKTANGFVISKNALDNLKSSALGAYQVDLNNAQKAAETVLGAEYLKQKGYDGTTKSIIALLEARVALLRAEGQGEIVGVTPWGVLTNYTKEFENTTNALSDLYATLAEFTRANDLFEGILGGGSSGGGGGSSSSSKEQTELKKLQEALDNYLSAKEHEIFLLEQQEGTEQEQIKAYKELQDALHATAVAIRALPQTEETKRALEELSESWYGYQSDIKKIQESIADNIKESNEKAFDELSKVVDGYKDYLKELNDAENDRIQEGIDLINLKKEATDKYYQDRIDQLQAEHDATEDNNTLLELQNELIKAQQELANASKERTVKQLQGQEWVWIQDPQTMQDLKDAVTNAQNAYNEEVAEQEYEEAVKKLEEAQASALQRFEDQIIVLEEELELANQRYEEQIDFLDNQLQDAEDLLDGSVDKLVTSLSELTAEINKYYQSISSNSSSVSEVSIPPVRSGSDSNTYSVDDLTSNYATSLFNEGYSYDVGTGTWIDPSGIPIYHSGTASVGSSYITPAQNETLALLEDKEAVLKAVQFMNVGKIVSAMKPSTSLINNNSNSNSVDNSQNINTVNINNNSNNSFFEVLKLAKMKR
jgi:TP901 family phage tail tape measure protein